MINIIEYNKGFEEDVKDLLTQLQEFVVKIDKEKLNIIAKNYREEYFKKTYTEVYSNQGKIFIAEEDGKSVGVICCFVRQYDKEDKLDYLCPKMGIITELIVDKTSKGKGIGKLLMAAAENYLKSIDCTYCMLDVFSYNDNAYNFYKKQNYQERMITMLKKF